jgi:hypothetical protein
MKQEVSVGRLTKDLVRVGKRRRGVVVGVPRRLQARRGGEAGNGRLGALLVAWCGGGDSRPSCKTVERVRIDGIAQTARIAGWKLTVAARAELQRRGGAAVGFRGN